jgi:hypothetical protein
MRDPVIAGDGHSYEREAIERWLMGHRTSPLTGRVMPGTTLIPNHRLRQLINDMLSGPVLPTLPTPRPEEEEEEEGGPSSGPAAPAGAQMEPSLENGSSSQPVAGGATPRSAAAAAAARAASMRQAAGQRQDPFPH